MVAESPPEEAVHVPTVSFAAAAAVVALCDSFSSLNGVHKASAKRIVDEWNKKSCVCGENSLGFVLNAGAKTL